MTVFNKQINLLGGFSSLFAKGQTTMPYNSGSTFPNLSSMTLFDVNDLPCFKTSTAEVQQAGWFNNIQPSIFMQQNQSVSYKSPVFDMLSMLDFSYLANIKFDKPQDSSDNSSSSQASSGGVFDDSSYSFDKSDSFTYDQSKVNELVNKYSGALKHTGDKKAFVQKLVKIAEKYHVNPEGIIVMFYSESAIKPTSKGGLFGAMRDTIKGYGTTIENFRRLSAIQQLDYYERYLSNQIKTAKRLIEKKNKKEGTNLKWPEKVPTELLYTMNFVPAYVADVLADPNHIIVSANSPDPQKRKYFYANCGRGSTANGTDHISFDTMAVRLKRKEKEASSIA